MRKAAIVALFFSALFLVVACGSEDEQSTTTSLKNRVLMKDNYFEPRTIKIKSGETVIWKNVGVAPHNVVAESFASDLVEPSEEFNHKFSSSGTFPYRCTIHPGMDGEVMVEK